MHTWPDAPITPSEYDINKQTTIMRGVMPISTCSLSVCRNEGQL